MTTTQTKPGEGWAVNLLLPGYALYLRRQARTPRTSTTGLLLTPLPHFNLSQTDPSVVASYCERSSEFFDEARCRSVGGTPSAEPPPSGPVQTDYVFTFANPDDAAKAAAAAAARDAGEPPKDPALSTDAGDAADDDGLDEETREVLSTAARVGFVFMLLGAATAGFHGYKRNRGDLRFGLGWGLAGFLAPLPMVGLAVYQGFGKPAGSGGSSPKSPKGGVGRVKIKGMMKPRFA